MNPTRRYDDDEARRIFDIAAGTDAAQSAEFGTDHGLTLAELQEIGTEAGLSPARVAEAARSIEERSRNLPHQTSLGSRVSAGQLIPLPRRPTEVEWTTLVTRFRDVFGATGEVRDHGDAREWSNGALRILLEPTVDGYQLRLTTVNRRLRSLHRVGAALAVTGLTFLAVSAPDAFAAGGGLFEVLTRLLPSLLVVVGGLGFVGYSAASLPAWASERDAQFAGLGDEAVSLLDKPPADGRSAQR